MTVPGSDDAAGTAASARGGPGHRRGAAVPSGAQRRPARGVRGAGHPRPEDTAHHHVAVPRADPGRAGGRGERRGRRPADHQGARRLGPDDHDDRGRPDLRPARDADRAGGPSTWPQWRHCRGGGRPGRTAAGRRGPGGRGPPRRPRRRGPAALADPEPADQRGEVPVARPVPRRARRRDPRRRHAGGSRSPTTASGSRRTSASASSSRWCASTSGSTASASAWRRAAASSTRTTARSASSRTRPARDRCSGSSCRP